MRAISLSTLAVVYLAAACEGGPPPEEGVPSSLHRSDGHVAKKVVQVVEQVNLTSDQPGKAANTDPNLVNAWGMAFVPGGPVWVNSAEKGLSEVYNSDGLPVFTVTIPPAPGGSEAHPTGLVFNPVDAFKGDRFIFVTEDGTISGWQPNGETMAELRVDNSGSEAIYKGVTLSQSGKSVRLLAADFHNRRIDVFDDQYNPVAMKHDAFLDPNLPPNFAPFNVLAKGQLVFVTFAQQDDAGKDDVAGAGLGYVDVFDRDGDAVMRLVSRGALNAPWGMAFMPPGDDLSVRLLVGNFGDGRINVYRLSFGDDFRLRADLQGTLGDAPDHPLQIDGLWAIGFGSGVNGFSASDLYFTAGPEDETHGLFGRLAPVMPTPPAP